MIHHVLLSYPATNKTQYRPYLPKDNRSPDSRCMLRVAGLLGAGQPFMLVRRPY
jgi:hypothetical protein